MQHKTRVRLGIGTGVVLGLIALGSVLPNASNGPSLNVTPSASTHRASASPSATPKAYIVSQRIGWAFKVTGSAPYGADITYGNDSDNRQGSGVVPFHAAMPGQSGAIYWAVSAQLQGGGDITARVYETKVTHWSDGIVTRTRQVVARAHASGGYNIANAEYTGLDSGVVHVGG